MIEESINVVLHCLRSKQNCFGEIFLQCFILLQNKQSITLCDQLDREIQTRQHFLFCVCYLSSAETNHQVSNKSVLCFS